jgi:hypothetical protein
MHTITSNTAYLAHVSGAFLDALRETQDMTARGEFGQPLADVLQHARGLHEIMTKELTASGNSGEYASGLLFQMGELLAA